MRVISGQFKGRRLSAPKGLTIRPTSDKVKGAIFNIIGERISESSFLDLFAGTGAIGIEAISRGAREITFVDNNIKAINLIKENLILCNLEKDSRGQRVKGSSENPRTLEPSNPRTLILKEDAIEFVKETDRKFDFIFLDPPYKSDFGEQALMEISRCNILKKYGEVMWERYYKRDSEFGVRDSGLKLKRTIRYGDTSLSFFVQGN